MTQSAYGRYRVVRPLGQGGMASVVLAEDPLLRRQVAIKVLRGDLGAQPDWVRRFHDEATAIARLGSPHVVQVFDFGREGQEDFLVLEYVDGISLSELLQSKGGTLEPTTGAAIACQVAEGLRAAHEAGIIHRDMKPDNILVRRDGMVKITDFGIARLMEEVSRTRTGSVFGSPLFMAPEQVEGRNPSGAIDVFALAGVLFRMLTGTHPFEAEHAHAVMWKIVQDPTPVLRSLVPSVPAELSDLAEAMHSKDPAQRPRASEIARKFRHILSQASVSDPVAEVLSSLPDSVVAAPSSPTTPPPTAKEPHRGFQAFLRKHRRLVPLLTGGAALTGAAFLAGKIWDRYLLSSIPEASPVDPSRALRAQSPHSPTTEESAPESQSPSGHEPAADARSPTPAAQPAHKRLPVQPPSSPPAAAPAGTVPALRQEAAPPPRVVARVRDEAPEDQGSVKPRIALVNRGPGVLHWVKASWKFELPPGPAPVLDIYYAPQCAVRLERDGWLVATCSGLNLAPGQSWPGPDGMSLALHHPDWRPWKGKAALGMGRTMTDRTDIQLEAR